jgi:iduronate 2-sulfatase
LIRLAFLLLSGVACAGAAAAEKMNVLFIISDDLRAELGCYGSEIAQTPNLDRLGERGVRFDRAYCQFPLCNPSRSSMLTGRRPTEVGVLGNRSWFGVTCPEAVSLPKHFRDHGYCTLRSGKIFHGGIDDHAAWSEGGEERYFGEGATAQPPDESERGPDGKLLGKDERSDRIIALPGDGSETSEHHIADRAIAFLRDASESDDEQPFLLMCGFNKPHSPLEAPQAFFDRFDSASIPLPIDYASRPSVPTGFPPGSIRRSNADLFVGRDSTPETAREMIRAYLASSAWMDHNAGRVLDALEELGLADSTIVVFWGDHGYQLGEKGKWSKAGSLWEQGLRVPTVIYDPRAAGNGRVCRRVVQSLDFFATLCELCELPRPSGVEGRSLKPFLDDPNTPSNEPAYSVWSEDGKHVTGVAVRTERWRYAEFFGDGAGKMLTDPVADPAETVNLAHEPAHAELVAQFSQMARDYAAGWLPDEATP